MSRIKVDRITDKAGTGAPILVNGMNVTGKSTMGDIVGAAVTFNSINSTAITGDVTGNLTGDVTGSGANLTNLPAGQLTGALPAISGANLTGIDASPQMTGIASGSLGSGKPVALTQDGKLMPITGVTGLLGTAADIPDTYYGGGLTYDSTNDKFVFFYKASNNHGKAVVGTLSGTTMTWGSPVTFTTATLQNHTTCAAFDAVNGKVLGFFAEGSTNGKVVVGQVSGTGASATITMGTPVTVVSAHVEHPSLCVVGSNYAIAYNNGGSNKGQCRIGKYDGTNSSSWPNSAVQFLNSYAYYTYCWHDTTADKLLIGFISQGGGNEGVNMVGTVSNDNVTFGSQYTYANSSKVFQGCGVHDSTTGKNLIVYTGSSEYGYANVLTISGTTISYGTQKIISSVTDTRSLNVAYDPIDKRFLVVFQKDGGTSGLKSQKIKISGTDVVLEGSMTDVALTTTAQNSEVFIVYDSTTRSFVTSFMESSAMDYYVERIRGSNVTNSNYVGITKAAYTDGQTATLSVFGSINEAVTGLTTATRYYVGADGSFISTADTEAISAGVALASNRLLLKGQ